MPAPLCEGDFHTNVTGTIPSQLRAWRRSLTTSADPTNGEGESHGNNNRKRKKPDDTASSSGTQDSPARSANDPEVEADELIKELHEIVKNQAKENKALKETIENLRRDLEAARRDKASAEAELQYQTTKVANASRACMAASDALDIVMGLREP
ncbi:hypothetical protein DL769_003680 [Monosporascus sp. CRB-8-3]|nr:hypothetical protein DL769_003680 [Monosporascus sp. CRB-8-3]